MSVLPKLTGPQGLLTPEEKCWMRGIEKLESTGGPWNSKVIEDMKLGRVSWGSQPCRLGVGKQRVSASHRDKRMSRRGRDGTAPSPERERNRVVV